MQRNSRWEEVTFLQQSNNIFNFYNLWLSDKQKTAVILLIFS